MPRILLETFVAAPAERCFDLARSIELHEATAEGTGERAVAGRTAGLIELGETVTWRARHLGVWQTLTVRITRFDRPRAFTDALVRGAFAAMEHEHRFEAAAGGTRMGDEFVYRSPLGPLGRLADVLLVEGHMRRFLARRAAILKRVAESEEWRAYLG